MYVGTRILRGIIQQPRVPSRWFRLFIIEFNKHYRIKLRYKTFIYIAIRFKTQNKAKAVLLKTNSNNMNTLFVYPLQCIYIAS